MNHNYEPAEFVSDKPGANEIGSRIRTRRKRMRATLKEVATAAGISESFLSQLERGRSDPSISTVNKIAGALGISTHTLFRDNAVFESKPIEIDSIVPVNFGKGARKRVVSPESFSFLEVLIGDMNPTSSTGLEPIVHGDSEEIMIVIEGECDFELEGTIHPMRAGDAIPYRSNQPHRCVATGESALRVMWIVAPATY
ncbi:helix-turn-helix domain-containing protein [Brevibacterium luteolum]|uniref:helix-turn-helix domain-containing protein n=1 Tax=Brevibacterium luteolum TaxID=199591 RepID=UPI003B68232A